MAPTISPKKTWEGMAGSVVLASVVAVLQFVFVMHQPWWQGVVLAVVVVIFGTAGDLIESMIKRDVGIKDMSSFLPGHGGVMDRLDSTLVAAPAAWLLFTLAGVAS
jgi:phosphatidate cytidylyltransferase